MSEVYSYLLEEEDTTPDGLQGEEEVIDTEDGDEDDSPFDRDDVEVAEAFLPTLDIDDDNHFQKVAAKILWEQEKLGRLRTLSLRIMSLDETKKRRWKEAGIFATSMLGVGAVMGALDSLKTNSLKNKKEIATGSAIGAAAFSLGGLAVGAKRANKLQVDFVFDATYADGKKMFYVFTTYDVDDAKEIAKVIYKKVQEQMRIVKKMIEAYKRGEFNIHESYLVSEGFVEDNMDKPNTFEYLANRILKLQKKLGKIESVTIRVMSIPNTKKKRWKEAGILTTILVATSTLAGAIFATQVPDENGQKDYSKKTQGIGAGLGAAIGLGTGAGVGISRALSKERDIVVIVKYKYGSKMFDIFPIKEDIDPRKAISLVNKKVMDTLMYLANNKRFDFPVKESVSLKFLEEQTFAEALLEAELLEI